MKKILSLLLVALMIVGMLPLNAIHAHAAAAAGDSVTYTFSSYTAGAQYAKNEEHVLDGDVTVVTNDCHFTSELRIYSSTSNNGYAIIKCTNEALCFSTIGVNAGNKKDTVKVYGSNDNGDTWVEAGGLTTTTTSYKDYSLTLPVKYKWLKLDVAGSNQVRLKTMTLTFAASENKPACEHTNTTTTTVDATCTTPGSTTVTCDDCKATVSAEDIDAVGHNYVDGFCSVCNAEKPASFAGRYYIATIRSSGNYFYMTSNLGTANTKRYQAEDSGLKELPESITAPENGKVFVLEENADGTYCIYAEGVAGDNYLGWSSSNSGTLVAESSAKKFTIKKLDDGTYNIGFDNRMLALNEQSGNNYFAFYEGTQKKNLSLIPISENAGCDHTDTVVVDQAVDANCTTSGLTEGSHCSACNAVIKEQEEIPAIGHNYVDGICANCSEPKPASLAGRYYIATIRSSGNYFYMTSDLGTASTKRYQAVDSGSTTLPETITASENDNKVFVLVENADGTYCIYAEGVAGDNYLGYGAENSGILVSEADALKLKIDKLESGLVNIHFAGDAERYLSLNATSDNNYFAFYKGTQKQDLSLIPVVEGGSETPDPSEPTDPSEPETPVDPPVTETPDTPTEAPTAASATITFDNTEKRTELSTEKQVWTENGITVTNNKGTGSNIVDNSNPARFYKNSELIIAYTGMTKIEISCTSAEYKTNLVNSLKGVDAKVTESDNVVTIALYAPADSFTFTLSGGQTRVSKITVYVEAMCDHSWGEWETTKAPNCTEAGEQTATCSKCNETKIQSIDATGHNLVYDGNTAFACDKCDYGETFTLSTIATAKNAVTKGENGKWTSDEVTYYIKGIVTYVSGKSIYIEDATGAICVYFETVEAAAGIAVGDELLVWDTITAYNGLIETDNTKAVEYLKASSNNVLPSKVVTIADLLADTTNEYLGERVVIENVTIGTMGTDNTPIFDNDGNSINIYNVKGLNDKISENDIVTVTAILSSYNGYQLLVNPGTAAADVIEVEHRDPVEIVKVTIGEAKAGEPGTFYQVEGTVTFINGRTVYIQDETGAIAVYLKAEAALTKVGNVIKVYGALKDFNGLLELDNVNEKDSRFYEILSSDNTVEAQSVTIEQLLADTTNEYLAEKVLLENVYISYSNYKNGKVTYTLNDGKGNTIKIYEIPTAEEDVLSGGTIVTVPAVVSCYNGYQLLADNAAIEVTGTCAHETTELVNFEAATLSEGGYTGDTMCSVCGYYTARGEKTEALTNVESWGLNLQDDILVKFQINVDASIRETAQIVINVGGVSYKYAVTEDGLYTANVAAAQMCDNITVQIVNGDDVSDTKTYTIKGYADSILNNSEMSQYHNVVIAMLHYGAAAQTYFKHNVNNLANADLEPAAEVDLSGVTAGKIESCDGFYGASLLFKERITVRFYFTTKFEGATEKNGLYYIDVADINPQDLDEAVTVTVNGLTVSYSPMNYILRMAEKGNGDLQALVKALYAYYRAAEDFVPAEQ